MTAACGRLSWSTTSHHLWHLGEFQNGFHVSCAWDFKLNKDCSQGKKETKYKWIREGKDTKEREEKELRQLFLKNIIFANNYFLKNEHVFSHMMMDYSTCMHYLLFQFWFNSFLNFVIRQAKDVVKVLKKRIGHKNSKVQLLALTVSTSASLAFNCTLYTQVAFSYDRVSSPQMCLVHMW